MTTPSVIPASQRQSPYATVHALSSGTLTLPLSRFISPVPDDQAHVTVPSLTFLIQHHPNTTTTTSTSHNNRSTTLLFDLGIRRDASAYPPPTQSHLKTRVPYTTTPDVSESLRAGGLEPEDVDVVMLSHVHWDHVGTPRDFAKAVFVVGRGSWGLLEEQSDEVKESHAHFEKGLLPGDRTVELPAPGGEGKGWAAGEGGPQGHELANKVFMLENRAYEALGPLPHVLDLFGTGLVYAVPAPGHLAGHTNLLVRLSSSWLYLAGDAAHDRRLLRGTHDIATWEAAGGGGGRACIHVDVEKARETLRLIRLLEEEGLQGQRVEVVFAHDVEWLENEESKRRFWPGRWT